MKTLVVVPVFNEEKTIQSVLTQISQFTSADVLVVNDGSTDSSLAKILESNVLFIINHEKNLGPGAAMISGFKFAINHEYDVVVTFDADGQHEASYIPELLSAIEDADMVVGSRYLPDSPRKTPSHKEREQASQALNKLVQKYSGYKITDCASGFRAYRVSSIQKLGLTENGYAWPFQLWIQAHNAGFKVKEIPIPFIYLDYKRDSHGEFRSLDQAIDKAKKIMLKELKEAKNGTDELGGTEIWARDNIGEIIPNVITPLSWSILNPVINNAFCRLHHQLGAPDNDIRYLDRFYGRGYINRSALESVLLKFTGLKPLTLVKSNWIILSLPFQIRHLFSDISKHCLKTEKLNLKPLTSNELLNQVDRLLSLIAKSLRVHITCTIVGDVFSFQLNRMVEKWGGKDPSAYSVLLTGLSGMKSAEPGIELWKLSQEALLNPKISECIKNSDPTKTLSALNAFSEGRIFAQKISDFLSKYGYFSLQELEISYPRWANDPTYVLTILKNYVISENSIDPSTFENRQRIQRLVTTSEIRKKLTCFRYFYRRPLFDVTLFEVQHCVVWRENTKQATVRVCGQLRRLYEELANRFVNNGLLDENNDIYFLTVEEIRLLEHEKIHKKKIKEIVQLRKQEREKNLKSPYPYVIDTSDDLKGPVKESEVTKPPTLSVTLKGVGCSIGRVTGKARVLFDANECQTFQKGEILVAPSTNPGWTPLFVIAGAVITEVGGVSSHGSVVAREYGIPCVVDINDATKIIKTGMVLTVDGEKGTVRLESTS